jgi:hypothetical protein
MGAILTQGDTRWFCVTLSVSTIVAVFLSLGLKRDHETIHLVISRAGVSLCSGVFVTRPFAWYFNLASVHTDTVNLAGSAALCCTLGFILGFAGLSYLMKRSDFLAKKFIDLKAAPFLSSSDNK